MDTSKRPLTDLLSLLVTQLQRLFRTEYQMARAEIGVSLGHMRGGIMLVAAAVLLVLPALTILLAGAAMALTRASVPMDMAAALVGGAVLLVSILVALAGISRIRTVNLVPNRTMNHLQRDVAAINPMSLPMNSQLLEARSDAERADVEATIAQLRTRLSPGQLVDELLAYTKDGGGEFVTNLGRQATSNPLPVSLIGAGLAWFLFSKGGVPAAQAPSSFGGKTGGVSQTNESHELHGLSAGLTEGAHAVADGVSAAAGQVSQGAGAAMDAMASASGTIKTGITEGAKAVGQSATAARRNVREITAGATDFLKEQPLILLGVGVALGAAMGASLPATEAENDVLGETSQDLKTQVMETASNQLDKAKSVGENLYTQVKDDLTEGAEQLSRDGPADDMMAER